MKQLKDYIHFYLNPFNKTKVLVDGEEIKYLWDIDVCDDGTIVNITCANTQYRTIDDVDDGWNVYNDDQTLSRIKPLLYPLSSMTEEQKKEVGFDAYQMLRSEHGDRVIPSRLKGHLWAAKQTHYLLSQHFDLFGLLETGLAIDKSKINQP